MVEQKKRIISYEIKNAKPFSKEVTHMFPLIEKTERAKHKDQSITYDTVYIKDAKLRCQRQYVKDAISLDPMKKSEISKLIHHTEQSKHGGIAKDQKSPRAISYDRVTLKPQDRCMKEMVVDAVKMNTLKRKFVQQLIQTTEWNKHLAPSAQLDTYDRVYINPLEQWRQLSSINLSLRSNALSKEIRPLTVSHEIQRLISKIELKKRQSNKSYDDVTLKPMKRCLKGMVQDAFELDSKVKEAVGKLIQETEWNKRNKSAPLKILRKDAAHQLKQRTSLLNKGISENKNIRIYQGYDLVFESNARERCSLELVSDAVRLNPAMKQQIRLLIFNAERAKHLSKKNEKSSSLSLSFLSSNNKRSYDAVTLPPRYRCGKLFVKDCVKLPHSKKTQVQKLIEKTERNKRRHSDASYDKVYISSYRYWKNWDNILKGSNKFRSLPKHTYKSMSSVSSLPLKSSSAMLSHAWFGSDRNRHVLSMLSSFERSMIEQCERSKHSKWWGNENQSFDQVTLKPRDRCEKEMVSDAITMEPDRKEEIKKLIEETEISKKKYGQLMEYNSALLDNVIRRCGKDMIKDCPRMDASHKQLIKKMIEKCEGKKHFSGLKKSFNDVTLKPSSRCSKEYVSDSVRLLSAKKRQVQALIRRIESSKHFDKSHPQYVYTDNRRQAQKNLDFLFNKQLPQFVEQEKHEEEGFISRLVHKII